jgi:hypothetical protein
MILGTRNLDPTEACKMWRQELGIEEPETTRPQPRDRMGKGDLRAIHPAREHAFAEEGRPDHHPIDPTGKLIILPDLDAVGAAHLMQGLVK